MNRLIFLLLLMGAFSCDTPQKSLRLNSNSSLSGEYLVSIPLESVKGKQEGMYPYFTFNDGKDTLTSQIIKKEGEVLVAAYFEGTNELKLNYDWAVEANYPTFTPRSGVRIGYSENADKTYTALTSHVRPEGHKQGNYIYQAEGPIWESDMVAFRTYFDARNGKDIFGKVKRDICAEEIGVSGNYHELQDWGMDILKVNNSLGAGALALKKNGSLYRLGATERSEMKVLTNGAVFSELLMDYDGWQVEENTFNVDEKITISAGHRFYKNEITLDGGSATDTLVTGIVDLYELPANSFEHNGYHVLYSHGAQSFIEDNLGMAVIVPVAHFAGTSSAPTEGEGVTKTHIAQLKLDSGKYQYYFYVGWEKEDTGFKEEKFFVEQIKVAIDNMSADITVSYDE